MKIKMLVMDVDGTLTDGKIYIGANGEVMKAFNVKDGYGIVQTKKDGVVPVIITGRTSDIVAARAKELGIEEFHQGVADKISVLEKIAENHSIRMEEIAYIGDDLNDLDCIKACGCTACPNDAINAVKQQVKYVCCHHAGDGAVREFIDWYSKL